MKRKRWQFWLIVSVVVLTVYNILPTVFYYTKPLSNDIGTKQSAKIASAIMNRVNNLEGDSISWLESFSKLIDVNPLQIKVMKQSPQLIEVKFATHSEADRFKQFLPRAGSLIPFYPGQLALEQSIKPVASLDAEAQDVVYVQRKIPVQFDLKEGETYFTFAKMFTEDGSVTKEYWEVLQDRLSQVALIVGGPTEAAGLLDLATTKEIGLRGHDFTYMLAQELIRINKVFGSSPALKDEFFSSFTQGPFKDRKQAINRFIEALAAAKDQIVQEKIELKERKGENTELEIAALSSKEETLLSALSIVKKHKAAFSSGQEPWAIADVLNEIKEPLYANHSLHLELSTKKQNPIISSIELDLENGLMSFGVNPKVIELQKKLESQKGNSAALDALNQLIYNEIAKVSRETEEAIIPRGSKFVVYLNDLPNASSFLKFDLSSIADAQFENIHHILHNAWERTSADFSKKSYPITEWSDFQKLSPSERHLQLVLYAPNLSKEQPIQGFRNNSIYIIAKDFAKIAAKFKDGGSAGAKLASKDFQNLSQLLKNQGFVGYPGTTYPLPAEYADDYIFEISDFYLPVLQATRENFTVRGMKKFAILELSDVKERILTLNKIETAMHEDLLKWRDEYLAAKVDPTLQSKYDVPAPTTNIFLNNLQLSWKKYFRGDERKVLKWGLDLLGGKTVQIALKDSNGKTVTNEADIRQGINELYNRVNKMGVSDVSIRQEGSNITIDFPGSQDISASQLVKASSMTFNIVNERFSTTGSTLSNEVNRFLQEVWNEAVVTNKKDVESINLLAWKHLYGDSLNGESASPRTDAAKALYENGLRLANPNDPQISNEFNDITSRIGMFRGDNFTDWHSQSHPLIILFKNYALEGSSLENIRGSYDPSKGNFLSFEIKGSQVLPSGKKISPRKDLYSWTSVFSKESVAGSQYESYSKGAGWRMAVVLNGYVVSTPHLESPLRDSGMITGHFTQREINQLAADLQAGSLTFTPQILSEKSVSPELGIKERYQGISATIIALFAVIVVMVSYYRFAGVVASVAVVLNLLIIWATLQNIGASITLAELAAVILTVGMAVDANVLVFERIREEYAKTKKLAFSVAMGYQKAFSAILDSNVTTIIAALILLHFDSGPIKGFAVSLIIGIVSSMFTALFATKYFFSKWIQNPKHKELKMANFIQLKKWNFLKYGKASLILSILLIVLGGITLVKERNTIFGMDFTGGYSVNLEVNTTSEGMYKERVEKALTNAGANPQDIHVRELLPTNHLRVFFATSMSENGRPFYNLPVEVAVEDPQYTYETNPKLVWVVNALKTSGIEINEKSLVTLDESWNAISGQMSDAMRNNAIIGLALALFCILIYITLRFEFKYAISATIGLGFDVLITVALLALLHFMNVKVQIDLNTVAALMTIVGYSLNDTIIVFDRIREDVKIMKHESFKDVVNHALNVTLSRTLMTSGTTLVVLLSLVLFGGPSIFGFSLIMSIGVVVGTLSTFFIATTLLSYFQRNQFTKGDETIVLNGL